MYNKSTVNKSKITNISTIAIPKSVQLKPIERYMPGFLTILDTDIDIKIKPAIAKGTDK